MKTFLFKPLLVAIACFMWVSSIAQDIPSKYLKGIDATVDEFTGVMIYSAKNCCLSISHNQDSTKLYISLSAVSFDSPIKLKKIYILTDGKTIEINHDEDFSFKEIPVRVMTSNATGNFGTSSYKGAEFGTRMKYIEEWKTEAAPYLSTIESIVSNLGKVKFLGENKTLFLEFSKKDAQRMNAILNLYKYLTEEF